MCPGKRLPILFAFLLILLIFYLPQPPIFPIAPCEPLKPLSRLQDLAEVWRQSEQICGEIGASLRTLYQVEQEEAGRLVLPKPLLEEELKYDYTKIGAHRPITLASFLLKTMEKVVLGEQLDTILKERPLYEDQHGFRSDMSTETALTAFVTPVEKAVQTNKFALISLLALLAKRYITFHL